MCDCKCNCNCQKQIDKKVRISDDEIGTDIGYIKDQLYNDTFYSYIPMFVNRYVKKIEESGANHISLQDIQRKYLDLLNILFTSLNDLNLKTLNVQLSLELLRYNYKLSNQIHNVINSPTRYFYKVGHEDDSVEFYRRSLFN